MKIELSGCPTLKYKCLISILRLHHNFNSFFDELKQNKKKTNKPFDFDDSILTWSINLL